MGKRELKPERDLQKRLTQICFILLAAVYLLIFVGLCHTPIYDLTGGHNDRFFSADDLYYVTGIYNATINTAPQIIKHPLMAGGGVLFTRAEQLLLGEVSQVLHYRLIVGAQIAAALLSVIYLHRILHKRYKLPEGCALILCGVYAAAMSTLFYTYIAESYIWSSLILIMTYYYAAEDRPWVTVILGAMAAGVTITNALLWAVIVVLSGRSWKERLAVLVSGGVLFCLLVAILPIGRQFFTNIIAGGLGSAQNYSDHYGILELVKRVFFAFFGSTAFYIDTIHDSPFGGFAGDALSFVPSASLPVVLMGLLWMALLIYAAVRFARDRRLWPPLGVLTCNLLLHGLVQYGLKEAFLYSLHHLSAQLLIVGLLFVSGDRSRKKEQTILYWLVIVYFLMELVLNIPGYREMLALVGV